MTALDVNPMAYAPYGPSGHRSQELDPNAAVFQPSNYPTQGMNYDDLMYYNYGYAQQSHQYQDQHRNGQQDMYGYHDYRVEENYPSRADIRDSNSNIPSEPRGSRRYSRGRSAKAQSNGTVYHNQNPEQYEGLTCKNNGPQMGNSRSDRGKVDTRNTKRGSARGGYSGQRYQDARSGDDRRRYRDENYDPASARRYGNGAPEVDTSRGASYDTREEVRVNGEQNRRGVDRGSGRFPNGSERRGSRGQERSKKQDNRENRDNRQQRRDSKKNDDEPRPPRSNDKTNPQDSKKTIDKESKKASKSADKNGKDRKVHKPDEFDFRELKKAGNEVVESRRGLLIEELTNGSYECMVCCEVVRREAAVWSCCECYHVFHLYCIKKWARSPIALVEGSDSSWRCPGCRNVTLKVPNQYVCFCGKQREPAFSPYETPHSCGEVCAKTRGGHCTHACNILCHPGPCPACGASITKSCSCGKTTKTVKCSQGADIRCEKVCNKDLNCGKHRCTQTCHSGGCEPCAIEIEQYCSCGKGFRKVVCGTREAFEGRYLCGEVCGKLLDCGEHTCEGICHEGNCYDCSLTPDMVEFCRCGKTALSSMKNGKRKSCTDPIPNCDKLCDKELPCGPEAEPHRCSQICHQGSCSVCDDGKTPVACRCGASVTEMSCKDAEKYLKGDEAYLCTRRCNRKRACGKHRCQQACCNETDHPCTQVCGRKLTCGTHRCEEPCHRGNCQSCWNVCFEEVTCHCGASVLDPPVPCGTRPPECIQLCQRDHPCQHPVRHTCHSEEKCPPCTQLTKKMCLGQHEMRHNIPCHIAEISCGLPCGKPLPCKQHKCIKLCHKGECLGEGEVCEQPCRTGRPWCDHPCAAPCHPGLACPDNPCEAKIELKCACTNRVEKASCGTGKRDMEAKVYQQMTNSSMVGKVIYVGNGQTIDISSLNSKKRQLECNEDCAKLERNRRLALALQIENPDISDKLGAPNYTEFLKDYAKSYPSFAAEVEKALSDLVQNAKSSKYPNRSHSFKPMKRDQRRFIHEIAEFYGCKSQSYDQEPMKSVVATAYKGKCWLPNMTLTAAMKRLTQNAPMPIPHNSTEKDIRAKSAASRLSTTALVTNSSKPKNLPKKKYIDYFDYQDDI